MPFRPDLFSAPQTLTFSKAGALTPQGESQRVRRRPDRRLSQGRTMDRNPGQRPNRRRQTPLCGNCPAAKSSTIAWTATPPLPISATRAGGHRPRVGRRPDQRWPISTYAEAIGTTWFAQAGSRRLAYEVDSVRGYKGKRPDRRKLGHIRVLLTRPLRGTSAVHRRPGPAPLLTAGRHRGCESHGTRRPARCWECSAMTPILTSPPD